MKNLLVINASPRGERSNSRNLTELFAKKWIESNPGYSISHREVGQEKIPHVSETWIAAAFKPADLRSEEEINALKISDQFIAELKAADVIVLGTPMYNWSVPSALKAYIDQIIRVNETIKVTADPQNPYLGLLKDKTVYMLISRGNSGYEKGEQLAHLNFQSDYLKTVFNIMGIYDIHQVILNGEAFGGISFEQSKKDVEASINRITAVQN
ncbi:FMN-dependent NADH-azoreductase AzoR1 [Mucilaginibacter gynuensis]|uniref:FMN dependent NADH:quinone oxidoreductase n=1 Tax=Mucilaginibacter gynuensis TaxID=1302236 RepID=A0ABP8FTH8_9SPHI